MNLYLKVELQYDCNTLLLRQEFVVGLAVTHPFFDTVDLDRHGRGQEPRVIRYARIRFSYS